MRGPARFFDARIAVAQWQVKPVANNGAPVSAPLLRFASEDMLVYSHVSEFIMTVEPQKYWVIASDVADRDGIGVEFYVDGDLVLEIFRDDTKKAREVTLYRKDVPLEYLEESIAKFKKENSWEFLEY
ncbi:hypothetical protein [Aminobacter aminovorans]|uniref:hypothetical protein n=1 Tax=Aminobacter aminovorans TaxID=83263 RepID=UPI00285A322B|nr:hypothetical protein [Aminobacter aminovorans]MDR7221620.1 chaperone required for assembly of F1-ATPase [Aminobacter aminovorans]